MRHWSVRRLRTDFCDEFSQARTEQPLYPSKLSFTNPLMLFSRLESGSKWLTQLNLSQYAPERIPYATKRYQDETKRLFQTYEDHLSSNKVEYLVGNKYSYADMVTFPWFVVLLLSLFTFWVKLIMESSIVISFRYQGVSQTLFKSWDRGKETDFNRPQLS